MVLTQAELFFDPEIGISIGVDQCLEGVFSHWPGCNSVDLRSARPRMPERPRDHLFLAAKTGLRLVAMAVDRGGYCSSESKKPIFLDVASGMMLIVKHDFQIGEKHDKDWIDGEGDPLRLCSP